MQFKKLQDAFNSKMFAGYLTKASPFFGTSNVFEAMFPIKTMVGLEYSYIMTANSAVELTAPSAFDAEPIAQHRSGFDARKGDLPLFRKKMVLSEKEKQNLINFIAANNEPAVNTLLTSIYDDTATLVQGALMTQEFLRARALMDGKISFESKGGAVTVDYKVDSTNKYTLSGAKNIWSDPETPIIDQIKTWLDKVEDETGTRPSRIIMNRKTFSYLTNNKQIRDNMLPLGIMASATVQANTVVTDAQIEATFKLLTGLSEVIVYNKKVQMDGVLMDLVEDNKIAIVPEGMLGNTMIGTSPAELNMTEANASGANITILGNGLAVNTYTDTRAPYESGTEIEFVGLPSLLVSDRMVLATVVS